jgi:crotonobetainyl-CoA:carnitine CoA-transferase CaiB-like acyl-CoA transferase
MTQQPERARLDAPPGRKAGAPLALAGIRVADFSHFLAGPVCSLILGDLGAEVIKIEKVEGGDDFRRLLPAVSPTEGAPFVWGNRNKRSIALDLKNPDGARIARDIVAKSDVLVENFSTGVMGRFGLDYEAMSSLNSRLIYCSVSAYGREGPLKDRLGFDPVAQAESGYMSMNGYPADPGMRSGPSIIDMSTGMMASNAVLAALFARERYGIGQFIDCVLFDQAVTMAGFHAMNYLVSGVVPPRFGNDSRDTVPTAAFKASDGPLYITCSNDRTYHRLVVQAMRRPDLSEHPDFSTNSMRVKNRDRLLEILGAIFATDTRESWANRLRAAGVPGGPINTLAEAFNSEQMKSRGLVSELPHAGGGNVPNIALSFRLSGTPLADPVAAPTLGQHTEEVLRELLGYGAAEIDALAQRGIIRIPDVSARE